NLDCEIIFSNNSQDLFSRMKIKKESLQNTNKLASSSLEDDQYVFKTGKSILNRELIFLNTSGEETACLFSKFPIQDEDGNTIGIIDFDYNISELKKKEKDLQNLIHITSKQNKRLLNFAHIVSHNLRSHSINISSLLKLYKQEANEQTKNEMFKL